MARREPEAPTPRERPATYKGLGSTIGTVTEIVPHPRNAAFLNVTVKSTSADGRKLTTRYEAVPRDKFMVEINGEVRASVVGDELPEHPPHNCRVYDMPWSPFDGEKDDD